MEFKIIFLEFIFFLIFEEIITLALHLPQFKAFFNLSREGGWRRGDTIVSLSSSLTLNLLNLNITRPVRRRA
jgi:hypothetical protein